MLFQTHCEAYDGQRSKKSIPTEETPAIGGAQRGKGSRRAQRGFRGTSRHVSSITVAFAGPCNTRRRVVQFSPADAKAPAGATNSRAASDGLEATPPQAETRGGSRVEACRSTLMDSPVTQQKDNTDSTIFEACDPLAHWNVTEGGRAMSDRAAASPNRSPRLRQRWPFTTNSRTPRR